MGIQSAFERAMLAAALRSWRFRNSVSFSVNLNGMQVPIANGMGLDTVKKRHDIGPKLKLLYSQPLGAFVDVGANLGRVMLELAMVDRRIPYIGFEPLPIAAAYVSRLISLNKLSGTHSIYPVGLSDSLRLVDIMTNSDADVSATITDQLRPSSMYRHRIPVCLVEGDAVLADADKIGVIKVDAEGSEMEVLAGLARTIDRHRPIIIIEVVGTAALEDGSYNRKYYGNLSEAERQRIVNNRKEQQSKFRCWLQDNRYESYLLRHGRFEAADFSETSPENYDFILLPDGVSVAETSALAHRRTSVEAVI